MENEARIENADLRSMTLEDLAALLKELGEPAFRAKQLFSWLHEKHVKSFDEMLNIPKSLRIKLMEHTVLETLEVEQRYISEIDGTRKYLFRLSDGNLIESVLMRYKHGNSVCVSSQVGCRMGCRFCASTLDGLVRNLKASEICEQVYRIEEDINERVSNIVMMGAGEPFDNYENTTLFIQLISHPDGICISKRNITVSTCGIVPRIYDFAKDHPQVTLALSLHAPNDEKRRELMPIANAYHLADVLKACKYYADETKRRVTFEYSLVKGVNDNAQEASQLCALLKGFSCHVNLIPVNPIKERDYEQSDLQTIQAFKKHLEKNGINATIRREMGRDINGACGQLRKGYIEANK